MEKFKANNTHWMCTQKRRVMLNICPISTNTQINGLGMKKITKILLNNQGLFVNRENSDLGLTQVVEHQFHLKPDAISKFNEHIN